MLKTIIQRGSIALAAAAAGGALAVLPSVSFASSTHACGNANAHNRSVRATNVSCRTARHWAARNRCPAHWTRGAIQVVPPNGTPDRSTCSRGRESFSWIHHSGATSGTGTTTIG